MTESDKQDLFEIIRFFGRHWKRLIVVVMIATIAAVLVTWRTPKKFTSSGLVYPPAFNSPSKLVDDPNFGYLIEVDRLMQIAQSAMVREGVFRNLNLAEHYGIDTNDQNFRARIDQILQRDIYLQRTKFMSVRITASTTDPELSADMVNEVIRLIGESREKIFKDNFKTSLEFLRMEFENQKKLVSSMMDSLHNLKNLNKIVSLDLKYRQLKEQKVKVDKLQRELAEMRWENQFYDLPNYMDELNQQLLTAEQDMLNARGKLEILDDTFEATDTVVIAVKAKLRGAEMRVKSLEDELIKLREISKPYAALMDQINIEVSYYHRIKQDYENTEFAFEPYISSLAMEQFKQRYAFEQRQLDVLNSRYDLNLQKFEQPLPSIYVVEYGYPSYTKSSPSLFRNVVMTVIPVFFLTLILLIILERLSSQKRAS